MRGCAAALMVCSYTFMDRSSNSALVSKCSRQDNAQGIRCETRQQKVPHRSQEVSVKFAQQKRRTDFDAMRTYCIVQGCQHRTSGARQHSNVTYLCICLSLGLLLMSASVCLSHIQRVSNADSGSTYCCRRRRTLLFVTCMVK